MTVELYNPSTGNFQPIETGPYSEASLLLNILIELRVQTSIMLQNGTPIADDVASLRLDQVNDASSLKTV